MNFITISIVQLVMCISLSAHFLEELVYLMRKTPLLSRAYVVVSIADVLEYDSSITLPLV